MSNTFADEAMPRICDLGNSCCGCGACLASCPVSCISFVEGEGGFLYPDVDGVACIGCRHCETVCPALSQEKKDKTELVLWAASKDQELLSQSSSGGVFGVLAAYVLNNGGVVCGASWDNEYRKVKHVIVNELPELEKLYGSKYVQSEIPSLIYQELREYLRQGKQVLFSGTACEIVAIRNYLGNEVGTTSLYLFEVICHGVPSPKLWEMWRCQKEEEAGRCLIGMSFRGKETGWEQYSLRYEYGGDFTEERDGFEELIPFNRDWYMKAFLNNASIRDSCFSCLYKRACGSDITAGDYWGLSPADVPIDVSRGVSAVICNTEKGTLLFESVKEQFEYGETEYSRIEAGNPALTGSVNPFSDRNAFINALNRGDAIGDMQRRWTFKKTIGQRIVGKIRSFFIK